MVTEATSRSTISAEILDKADEKKENAWLHSVVYDDADQDLRGISANEAMFRMQSSFILGAAQKNDCIFVGRCADYVLQQAAVKRLSIFITAPYPDRVQRKMRLLGKEERAVTALVRKMDKQRKSYYDYYTGGSWGKPYNYDLCVNSSTLGVEQTAEVLAVLARHM